ncbi:hypothetical protein D3P96_03675 [Weissella viridescens]|uniref:Antirestriction protein n=1 Tax=Weissella viridescens TaxID=1629 RepID=A0A3P2RFX7_WEIVI|nr:hypothetical protein [Weissella viridescens]RRG18395.1 hypothetical protein D3P96_03675 [Weissella viridescens]
MSFSSSDAFVLLKNYKNQVKRFTFPFDANAISDWTDGEEFTILEHGFPFGISTLTFATSGVISYLNEFLEALQSSSLGKLSEHQIAQFFNDEVDVDEITMDDLQDMFVTTSNKGDMAVELADVSGDMDTFVNNLPGGVSDYIDWDKVGQTLIDNSDIIDLDGAYIAY